MVTVSTTEATLSSLSAGRVAGPLLFASGALAEAEWPGADPEYLNESGLTDNKSFIITGVDIFTVADNCEVHISSYVMEKF